MNMPKTRKKDCRHTMLLIAGAVGVILFWRGVWALADMMPVIENPWVSFLAGIFIIVLSHQLYREL